MSIIVSQINDNLIVCLPACTGTVVQVDINGTWFLWIYRSQGESNTFSMSRRNHMMKMHIGPSVVGAEETSDYHIYGITQNWPDPWWRHKMETFSALLALCVGNSPVIGEFPSQRPVTRNFDVFFDLCLKKRLSKRSRRRWFEMSWRLLWRHCNDMRVSWTYRYCHLEIHCWMKYIWGSGRAGSGLGWYVFYLIYYIALNANCASNTFTTCVLVANKYIVMLCPKYGEIHIYV